MDEDYSQWLAEVNAEIGDAHPDEASIRGAIVRNNYENAYRPLLDASKFGVKANSDYVIGKDPNPVKKLFDASKCAAKPASSYSEAEENDPVKPLYDPSKCPKMQDASKCDGELKSACDYSKWLAQADSEGDSDADIENSCTPQYIWAETEAEDFPCKCGCTFPNHAIVGPDTRRRLGQRGPIPARI